MRSSTFAIATCLGLLAPVAAVAQDPQPAPTLEPASVAGSQPLICHYYYHEGSLIRRKDCRSPHQWDRIRHESEQDLVKFQMRGLLQRN
jgi:hypothetical protein